MSRHAQAGGQRGVVLVALLLAMMFTAVLALAGAETWATTLRREREVELLFVGAQYRQAIRAYYFGAPPGQARVLPARLEDLLEDRRHLVPTRYLRRLYPDPISGTADWGLALRGDRIAGVYSRSDATPLKQTNFDRADSAFEGRGAYKDWVFQYVPPAQPIRRRSAP